MSIEKTVESVDFKVKYDSIGGQSIGVLTLWEQSDDKGSSASDCTLKVTYTLNVDENSVDEISIDNIEIVTYTVNVDENSVDETSIHNIQMGTKEPFDFDKFTLGHFGRLRYAGPENSHFGLFDERFRKKIKESFNRLSREKRLSIALNLDEDKNGSKQVGSKLVKTVNKKKSLINGDVELEVGSLDQMYEDLAVYEKPAPVTKDRSTKPEFLKSLLMTFYRNPDYVKALLTAEYIGSDSSESGSSQKKVDWFEGQPSFPWDKVKIASKNLHRSAYKKESVLLAKGKKSDQGQTEETEGVFFYYDYDDPADNREEAFLKENGVIGYQPYVRFSDKNDTKGWTALAGREVKYESYVPGFYADNKEKEEDGWVILDALMEGADSLWDHLCLGCWLGHSLGAPHPLLLTEQDSNQPPSDREYTPEAFINDALFRRTVLAPKKQLPLIHDRKYEFKFLPMNILGNHREEEASDEYHFKLTEPISAPIIGNAKTRAEEGIVNVVLRESSADFLIFPPALQQGHAALFSGALQMESNSDTEFRRVFHWVKGLQEPVFPLKKNALRRKIWYTFDKRVIGASFKMVVHGWKYNELGERELYELVSSDASITLWKKGMTMEAVRPIPLKINIIEPSSKERVVFNTERNAISVQIDVRSGAERELHFGFNDNLQKITIISPIQKVDSPANIIVNECKTNELKVEMEKVDCESVDYYTLFRRYVRVFPSENPSLPSRERLIKIRSSFESITIEEETDRALFAGSRNSSTYSIAKIEGQSNEDAASSDKSQPRTVLTESSILRESNVFSLEEVFGHTICEIVNPDSVKVVDVNDNDGVLEEVNAKGNQIGVGSINKKRNLIHTVKHKLDDERGRRYDYINLKFYSRFIENFKETRGSISLKDLDFNRFQEDVFSAPSEALIEACPAPRFELGILHRSKIEGDRQELNSERYTILMISMDPKDANMLSDQEYIGVDFRIDATGIPGTEKEPRTSLGTDFAFSVDGESQLKAGDLLSAVNLKDGKVEIIETEPLLNLGKNIAFFKPIFLYDQELAAVFLTIPEDKIQTKDPFLKVSLCRGFRGNGGDWSVSKLVSQPQYIQYSTKRHLRIERSFKDSEGKEKKCLKIDWNDNLTNTDLYVAFYSGSDAKEFEEPLELTLSYNDKTSDKVETMKLRYIRVGDNRFWKKETENNNSKWVFQPKVIERVFRVKIFEFATPVTERSVDDPFNESDLKLLFASSWRLD